MRKDGSDARMLAEGRIDGFLDAGNHILVRTLAGEYLELDDSGPGLSPYCGPVEARDPPAFRDGQFWFVKEGKGLFRRAPGTTDELFVSSVELIFAASCSTGIAGWLREGESYVLAVVDLKTGTTRTYLKDVPGFLVAHEGLICYASFEGGVHAVDLATGKDRRLSDLRVEGRLVPAGGRLWAAGAADGGRLHAIDLDTGKDEIVSADSGCRVLAANARGIWYARRPGQGAGMVWGANGNESLCFWAFDGKGNRERLFAGKPFSPVSLGGGWGLGRFPSEGEGLWALSLSDFCRTKVAQSAMRIAAAWTDGLDVFFIDLEDADRGPLLRVPLSGTGSPQVLIASCSSAWPVGNDMLFTTDEGLHLRSAAGAARLLLPGTVLRVAWDGTQAYALVDAGGRYDILRVDPEDGKTVVVKKGVRPGMGQVIVASKGILWYDDGPDLRRYDPAKAADSVIASLDEGFVMGMAVGNGFLYFAVDRMGGDGIYRVADSGGAVVKVADGELFGLAAEGGFVYWFSDWVEKNEDPEGASYAYRMRE